ncbi:hypothetical protein NE237_011810 [Protea cynaroides]|uniref:FAR1 domain-containing protein n=1 Tax=Protea cynaroides TaxID=273540 RepID=A0A9Q0GVP9_9MAGN|nr:hypothetical protein NE237_011810 [Protea cynaroides]
MDLRFQIVGIRLCATEEPDPLFSLFSINHIFVDSSIHTVNDNREFMDFGLHLRVSGEELGKSTAMVVREGPSKELVESSDQEEVHQGEDGTVSQSSSGRTLAETEANANLDPQVGMEFESETAVHAFYSAYAMRTGFTARSNKVYRSRRDRAIIGREFVCNKEGFRVPDKRRSVMKPRAPTRLGCKAMIAVKKLSSGKWTISRFVKEHSHPLTPGKNRKGSLLDQYPNEHEKIQDLSQQLLVEKRRCTAYRKQLDLLFKYIEEHTHSMSEKIQHIVDTVNEFESGKSGHQPPR